MLGWTISCPSTRRWCILFQSLYGLIMFTSLPRGFCFMLGVLNGYSCAICVLIYRRLFRKKKAWYINVYMSICCFRNMGNLDGVLLLTTVTLLLAAATANRDEVYFSPTEKPLQCHEIRTTDVRSTVQCALQCLESTYSCVGYLLNTTEGSNFQCDICFI